MTTRFSTPAISANQFGNKIDATPNDLSRKIEILEFNLLNVKFTEGTSSETQFYFFDAKKMLDFARSNFEKGFYNVSGASLILADKYLEKCNIATK